MKMQLMLALAASLVLSPAAFVGLHAAEAKADAEAEGAAVPAKPKKKVPKKHPFMKMAEAKACAEAAEQPIVAFLLLEDQYSQFIQKKLMANKLFKELMDKNAVVLCLRLKVADPKATEKKINLRPLKEPDRKLLENVGLDEQASKQRAAQNKPELKFDDVANYPAIVGVSSDGTKSLFRMGRYDADGGMGVWLSQVADMLRTAGIEPVIPPKVQALIENPDGGKAKKK